MKSTIHSPQSSSPGVALVMVLGILSVMVIMAVAFAIAMRTERVAAGNYADSVRARQLVQVGLARALDDLAVQLGTNGLMSSVGGTNYPPWDVTNSYTAAYTNDNTDTNRLLLLVLNRENEATNFVPRSLWAAAMKRDYSNPSNHWLPIDSIMYTNDSGGTPRVAESNRMGRVKYLILNCSGLLDANFVGGAARGVGMDPNEIAIDNMGDFVSGGAYRFCTNRPQYVRYETLPEFYQLNRSRFNKWPSNFVTYSHSPAGYWHPKSFANTIGTNINLSGSADDLEQRQDDIINAFVAAGYTEPEAGILFTNLLDYVDMDCEPRDLHVSVEPVPMINEIVFSNRVTMTYDATASPVTYTYDILDSVIVELWYPFALTNYQNFSLEVSATFGDVTDELAPPPIVLQSRSVNVRPNSFGQYVFSTPKQVVKQTDPLPNPNITCTGKVTLALVKLSGGAGTTVDKLDAYPTVTNINNVTVAGQTTISTNSLECLDPRSNWDAEHYGAQWYWTNLHSLGRVNGAITNSTYNLSLADGDLAMHCDVAESVDVTEIGTYHLIVPGHRAYKTGQAVTIGALSPLPHVYYAIVNNSLQPEKIELAKTYADAMAGTNMTDLPSGITSIKPTLQSIAELGYLRYSVAPWTTVKLYGTALARETIKPFVLWPAIPFTADSANETIQITHPYAHRTTRFVNGLPITVSSSDKLPRPLLVHHTYLVTNCNSETKFQLLDPASGNNNIVQIDSGGNGTHVLYPARILPDSYSVGMINPNKSSPLEVLSALFQDIPVEPFPGAASEVFTVDTTLHALKVSGRRAYYTGSAVRLSSTGDLPGTPNGKLSNDKVYYVIQYNNTPDIIKLADTHEKAMKDDAISIDSIGSGIHSIRSTTLGQDEAKEFAQAIIDGHSSTNISDVGKVLVNYKNSVFGQEMEKESVLRSIVGLVNTHQVIFTIIIEAHVASGGNIPRSPVRQRAVALVWRDPYTGEMLVRSIKWLKD